MSTVVVFGGSGFLGRRLVRRLAGDGLNVRVAVRHPAPARSILKAAGLDRVTVQRADVCDQAAVAAAVAGADAVVNAVSAYVERGGETFEAVHVRGAEMVARGAAAAGVARLVLVSGIGADPESRSPYIRARGRGERAVQREFPGATIVRPSAMFGPGDALFGTLADLARLLPMLPLTGAGRTRLQPVYVEDVAEAVARMLADPMTASLTYENTGPNVYTRRELVGITLRLIGRRRLLVPVPFAIAEVLARLFELLPSPPLTTAQVDLLGVDYVASGTLPGLQDLNIQPKAVEEVVPTYIRRSRASEPDRAVDRPKIGGLCYDRGGAMEKVDPSETKLALPREASRPDRLRAVSLEALAQILSAHRIYLETSREQGTRADLSATDLTGCDLSGKALRRIKLDHALLRSANLAYANLQRANLIGADLGGACLTGADLEGARMSGANLDAAQLDAASLVGADLEFAVMTKAVLWQACLRGADMSGVNLEGADLRNADLRDANLRGASLRRARMDRADLRTARLGGAFLDDASLRQADLRGAYLRLARFDDADLSAADLRDTQGLVRAQLATALCLIDSRLPTGLSAPE